MEQLTAKAAIGIQKPVSEIFEAIINPEIMKNFFISKSTGNLEVGKEVFWSFPEFDGSYPVVAKEILENERIIFEWDPKSLVTIELRSLSENDTVVSISEKDCAADDNRFDWAVGQTEGWANFLACMKAWLEHHIRLRKGAFDFMKTS